MDGAGRRGEAPDPVTVICTARAIVAPGRHGHVSRVPGLEPALC